MKVEQHVEPDSLSVGLAGDYHARGIRIRYGTERIQSLPHDSVPFMFPPISLSQEKRISQRKAYVSTEESPKKTRITKGRQREKSVIMKAGEVLPMALLFAAEDWRIKGRTRFQKLAFLAGERLEDEGIDAFDFVPYDYGPYSKDLQQTIDWLRSEGLISVKETRTYGGDTRYDYRLTEKGSNSFKRNLNSNDEVGAQAESRIEIIYDVANEIVSEFNSVPISNLLDYVYSEFPEYAENSVLY